MLGIIAMSTKNIVPAMVEHPGTRPLHNGGVTMSTILSGIYEIRNTINGHIYIGSSVNTKYRWRAHKKELNRKTHHNRYLQRAWNKYGESSFKFSVIEYCDKSILISREQYYLDALKPEYNIAIYANAPTRGIKLSFETRKKLQGRKHTDEAIKKIVKALVGRPVSKKTREKIRKSHIGMKYSDEAKRNMSKSHIGHVPWNKGISHSESAKEKNRLAHLGKLDTNETKKKKSAAIKAWWKKRKRANE